MNKKTLKLLILAFAAMGFSFCLSGSVFAASSTTVYCYQAVPGSEVAPVIGEFSYGQGVDQFVIDPQVWSFGSKTINIAASNNTVSCAVDNMDAKYILMFKQDGKTVLSYTLDGNDSETNKLNIDLSKKTVTRNETEHYKIDPNVPSKLVLEDGVSTSDSGGNFDDITLSVTGGSCSVAGDGGNKYIATFHADGDDVAPWAKNGNMNTVVFKSGQNGETLGTCGAVGSGDDSVIVISDGKQYKIPIKDGATSVEFGLQHNNNGELEVSEISQPTSGFDSDEESQVDVEEVTVEDVPTEVETTCANSGGAMSLGWIVCPILDWLGSAADNVYTNYVEPSLRVDPQLFNGEGNEGVSNGWETFRNIANVMFIILLLVVIFSQLTGVGIDNYGIKKILPKLIVVAVLINLSYVICLVAVDLSNIVGNGLRALFDSLGANLPAPELTIEESTLNGTAVTTTVLTGVGVLGMLVAMGGLVWKNPAILLSLLVAALGIVVAIFFLFILLAAREAAIIVLTVISPLAFACYMLPNTKKLFDRWLNFGKGLLLVYPICGLLVGGGNYVSNLLLSAGFAGDGFLKAFTAMIVGVLPIFFIPTILKSSFAALGKVGATLSGMGARARGATTKRMRDSQAYKTAQERGLERQTRIKAGVRRNGEAKKMGAFGRLARGGSRNIARARAQYLRNQDTQARADSLMGVGFEAATIGQTKKAEKEMVADYMTLINSRTRNGEDTNALYGMYEAYLAAGDRSGAVAVAKIAGRRKDTADDFLKNYVRNTDIGAYNKDQLKAFESVAKEVSTGENSGNFRTSAPLSFEFMAQYNRDPANAEKSYSAWTSNQENVHRAMDNYITNSQELVGMKGSALRELNDLKNNGGMDKQHADRLEKLAGETIDNRAQTGVWDTTKSDVIHNLAGRATGNSNTGGGSAGGSTGGAGGSSAQVAQAQQEMNEAMDSAYRDYMGGGTGGSASGNAPAGGTGGVPSWRGMDLDNEIDAGNTTGGGAELQIPRDNNGTPSAGGTGGGVEVIDTDGYDFRGGNNHLLEDTFLEAAANSFVDSSDIGYIDNVKFGAEESAKNNGASMFDTLKALSRESNPEAEGGLAAMDLMDAYIDTASTYAISRDEKVGRGFARGLLTNMEMRMDTAEFDKPNGAADRLRTDLGIIKPMAEEFIESYNPSHDDPNAFRNYLRAALEAEEVDIRSARNRGERPAVNTVRKAQAIRTALDDLADLQSNYEKNLQNLRDTAYANHRILK